MSDSSFTLVDYETAHLGDPAFDIGFFLSHLFLKAIHQPAEFHTYRALLTGFWRGYQDTFPFKPAVVLIGDGVVHLGGCLLARVDGASPAPYLTDERKRDAARQLGRRILLDHLFDWNEVVESLSNECKPFLSEPQA